MSRHEGHSCSGEVQRISANGRRHSRERAGHEPPGWGQHSVGIITDKQSERMKVVCGEREGYNNTVALLFVGGRGSKEKFVLFVRGKLDGRVRYNASHGGAVASPKAQ